MTNLQEGTAEASSYWSTHAHKYRPSHNFPGTCSLCLSSEQAKVHGMPTEQIERRIGADRRRSDYRTPRLLNRRRGDRRQEAAIRRAGGQMCYCNKMGNRPHKMGSPGCAYADET